MEPQAQVQPQVQVQVQPRSRQVDIVLDPSLPATFVDVSNVVIHQFYAAVAAFRRAGASLASIDTRSEAFRAKFVDNVVRAIKCGGTATCRNLVLLRDCPRRDVWRLDTFPGYKSGRDRRPDTKNKVPLDPTVFDLFFEHAASKMGNPPVVHHPRMEADDCAYVLSKMVPSDMEVVFLTNDNDYYQLTTRDGRRRVVNGRARKWRDHDVARALTFKVLTGDKSDSVPAAFHGCGPVTATRLCGMSEAELNRWLIEKKPDNSYLRNRTLIDLSCVPERLVSEFTETYRVTTGRAARCVNEM